MGSNPERTLEPIQHYNDEKAVDALIILLSEDEDVYVRIFASDSLLALNRPRLREVWQEVLNDESTYVIEIANQAICQLQNSKIQEVAID